MELASFVYSLTESFPKIETYGLVSQMRRAAVSVPANLAEGAGRNSRKELAQFVGIAAGSIAELDTLAEIAARLDYLDRKEELQLKLDRVNALLIALRKRLRSG
jgi:four helix bundle protein